MRSRCSIEPSIASPCLGFSTATRRRRSAHYSTNSRPWPSQAPARQGCFKKETPLDLADVCHDPACPPGARDAQPVTGGFAVPAVGKTPETAEASAVPRRTADSSAPTTRKNSPAGKVQLHPAPPAGLNPTGVTNGPGVRRPRAENPRQRSGNETAPGGPRDERLNSTTISPGEQMRLA